MKKINTQGFQELSVDEQSSISGGASLLSGFSGLSGLLSRLHQSPLSALLAKDTTLAVAAASQATAVACDPGYCADDACYTACAANNISCR
ncbi:MAG: hypothetical protein LBT44_08065 [Clostridiales bacterium]|jgi:hypothetical protein|nr:hypothetical protein [Clostridiales bacterium]